MSIRRTKQTSDTEKRFQRLHQQIYGKPTTMENTSQTVPTELYSFKNNPANFPLPTSKTTTSDLDYLKTDLSKILILACLAIGTELLLFFLNQHHYLNLNFLKFN